MYSIGEFVVNAKHGICKIIDIEMSNLSGKVRQYYILVPTEEKTAKIFLPVDNAENRMRPAMRKEDARKLIEEIKTINEIVIENEKDREKKYKDAINSRDPKRLISIIKAIYVRSQKRMDEGKKCTTIDERYFKMAENHLYSELAFSLGVQKSEITQIIKENME